MFTFILITICWQTANQQQVPLYRFFRSAFLPNSSSKKNTQKCSQLPKREVRAIAQSILILIKLMSRHRAWIKLQTEKEAPKIKVKCLRKMFQVCMNNIQLNEIRDL